MRKLLAAVSLVLPFMLATATAATATTYAPETSSRFPSVQYRKSSAGLPCSHVPWQNEAQMLDECWQPNRDTYVYDPGRGHRIGDTDLGTSRRFHHYYAKQASSRAHFNYSLNFLYWAPVGTITVGGGAVWYGCPDPNYRPSYMHIGGFCIDDQATGPPSEGGLKGTLVAHRVRADLANGRFRAKYWDGHFIGLACGNPDTMEFVAGPVPTIVGHTFHDLNRNGSRDAGEPDAGGFRLRLTFNGQPVATTTSAADGSYRFPLDAQGDGRSGAGTYGVEMLTRSGWVLTGSTSRAATVPWNAGARTITWDFSAWQVPSLSVNDIRVDPEGTGRNTDSAFTLSLSQATGVPITVNVAAADGTATSPDDYKASAASVTIPAERTSATYPVSVVGDSLDEGDETFTVTLANASSGATIADGQGLATIVDDDPPPTVSVNDVRVPEGSNGALGHATFTVSLSAPSAKPITVDYKTADETARAPDDYHSVSGTATFAPGQTTKMVQVPIVGDDIDEPDETFALDLSDPGNTTIAAGHGVGTIVDDDAAPTVAINDVQTIEGDSGTTPAAFTVSLSGPSGRTISVDYGTADGTARASDDYEPANGTLEFAPGETSKPITVLVKGDIVNEPDETYHINLSSLTNVAPGDTSGLGTIIDDERAGQFSCRASAIRLGTFEPEVANPSDRPCVDDVAEIPLLDNPALGLTLTGLSARTEQDPGNLDANDPAAGDHGAARADLVSAKIRIGLTTIGVEALHAEASATCDAGASSAPTLKGASRLGRLTINGIPIPVGASPLNIPLGVYTLHLNSTTQTSDAIAQRTLWLEPAVSGLPQVVLAEAKADRTGSPCREKAP